MSDGVVPDAVAAHVGSCEDADPAGADKETDDDENDAEQNLPSKRGDDAGYDQDHGDNPQQSGHETSPRLSDRRGWRPRFNQPAARAVVYTPRDDYGSAA